MIHIDAREGVSADMLLAAMLHLLRDAAHATSRLSEASESVGIRFHSEHIEEDGQQGMAISYIGGRSHYATISYHEAHRRLREIADILGSGAELGEDILDMVFEAEAAAHGVPKEEVHLHEIGRPQGLVNIAGIGYLFGSVSSPGEEVLCSTITTGKGTIVTAHGPLRVPAPATEHLLRGLEHVPGDQPGERATPTGVAALSALSRGHSDDIQEALRGVGVGFGTKRFGGRLGRVTLRRH